MYPVVFAVATRLLAVLEVVQAPLSPPTITAAPIASTSAGHHRFIVQWWRLIQCQSQMQFSNGVTNEAGASVLRLIPVKRGYNQHVARGTPMLS